MATVYIASSWKNQHAVEMLTDMLEAKGHEVKSFVREAVIAETRNGPKFDLDDWINSDDGSSKFKFDLAGATQSDFVIYLGPSGSDAWAEIGAAWASGQVIFGLHAKGEQIGLMRRMVAHWYSDYRKMLADIEEVYGNDK